MPTGSMNSVLKPLGLPMFAGTRVFSRLWLPEYLPEYGHSHLARSGRDCGCRLVCC